ncbi:hypothetical protein [Citrobacter sp. JGM124]|nr:hypothetical protein [Citrobacter sp. JGM124]MBS0848720.1 hypothetical protein [Citrobacter sp. JGM124]
MSVNSPGWFFFHRLLRFTAILAYIFPLIGTNLCQDAGYQAKGFTLPQ